MNFIDKLILILIIVGSIIAILSYIGTKISFNEHSSSAEKIETFIVGMIVGVFMFLLGLFFELIK